jgi:hypothetical protein
MADSPLTPMQQPIVDPGSDNVQQRPDYQRPAPAGNPTTPPPTTGPKNPS